MKANSQSEELLASLREDFKEISQNMKEFSLMVISEGISSFPTYVAYDLECGIGKPFARKEFSDLNWNYNASVLEEFVTKGIISEEKVADFMNAYSDPQEKACILLLLDKGANLVFIPFD